LLGGPRPGGMQRQCAAAPSCRCQARRVSPAPCCARPGRPRATHRGDGTAASGPIASRGAPLGGSLAVVEPAPYQGRPGSPGWRPGCRPGISRTRTPTSKAEGSS
jgi:hypothetical protein